MNVRDSEVISGLLKNAGYALSEDETKADIVVFNTCSVRQHAEDKVWSAVGKLRAINHKLKNKPLIGIVGCMANNYREAIFDKAPSVDFVVGTADIHKIPQIINSLSKNKGLFETRIWETDGEDRPEEIYHTGFHLDHEHAFVVISEGCENYCSYCVVPYVRGKLRSRSPDDIIKEVKQDIKAGIRKITLLGQNVNAYQSQVAFPQLLLMVDSIDGLKEFSFVTSHPKDTSLELFSVMADCDKLKKSLHLPVQSGSDRILKLMGRGYTRKFYLDLADNYRKMVKRGVLTTDIIVGFPTESQGDFKDTYDLVRDIAFDAAYIFKYSPRPNTAASRMVDDVAKEEKERRHKKILDLQRNISNKKKCKER